MTTISNNTGFMKNIHRAQQARTSDSGRHANQTCEDIGADARLPITQRPSRNVLEGAGYFDTSRYFRWPSALVTY